MRRLLLLIAMLLLLGLAAGCGDDDEDSGNGSGSDTAAETEKTPTAPDPTDEFGCVEVTQPDPKPDGGEQKPTAELSAAALVTFKTNCGSFTVRVDQEGGLTAASFVQLAENGFYEDTFFHRIAPGFVIQGGDPLGTGLGGPGYQTRDAPPDGASYPRYTIAMAKGGAEPAGTSGSQFFVMTGDGGLPPEYAIVGEVTRGKKVVDTIGQFGDPSEQPTRIVAIEKTTVRDG